MNPDLRSTCIPLIVFVLAAGCDQDIADVVPSTASANADQADIGAAAGAVTSTMPIPNAGSDSERDGERDPGDPPMIDFSMLDVTMSIDPASKMIHKGAPTQFVEVYEDRTDDGRAFNQVCR